MNQQTFNELRRMGVAASEMRYYDLSASESVRLSDYEYDGDPDEDDESDDDGGDYPYEDDAARLAEHRRLLPEMPRAIARVERGMELEALDEHARGDVFAETARRAGLEAFSEESSPTISEDDTAANAVSFAEGLSWRRHGKPLAALPYDVKNGLLEEGAAQAGYRFASFDDDPSVSDEEEYDDEDQSDAMGDEANDGGDPYDDEGARAVKIARSMAHRQGKSLSELPYAERQALLRAGAEIAGYRGDPKGA